MVDIAFSGKLRMNRDCTLGNGLANLSDSVQVIDRDGTDLGTRIVSEAQRLAVEQGGELVVIGSEEGMKVVRIVIVRKAPFR